MLFIDPVAKRKSLYEFDHVPVTAPQYPDPIVLKASAPMEIPEGSVLCSAAEATMIQFRDKRVIGAGEHPRPAGPGRRGLAGVPRGRPRGGAREDGPAARRPEQGVLQPRPKRRCGLVVRVR